MSVLETPRIYFKGQVTWDPIVTNNYCSNYDESTGETIYPTAANQVKAFREGAIGAVTQGGNWNPHGTHRSKFFETTVSGFDLGNGTQTVDPFVSAAVDFNGMLVDLEPFGSFSSQLFFDRMCFGVDGGYRIFAPRTSRVTARYINFARNSANAMIAGVASVVWQTSFAKTDGLRIDAFDSELLKGLATAIEPADVLGLTVRFNAYRTIYFDNPQLTNGAPASRAASKALQDKLTEGGFQPNPARSLLVGVLGLWRKGEPGHEAGDRVIAQLNPNSTMGSAYLRISGNRLTLDLGNSVMEIDKHLEKQDLGVLSVAAVDPVSGAATNLASIPYSQYDRTAYDASAGIVTVQMTTGAIGAGKNIEIRNAADIALLKEIPMRAVPETPNLYLDEGHGGTARFQIYERGEPATKTVQLTLFRLKMTGGPTDGGTTVTTDPHGILDVPLNGLARGITAYVPSFNADDLPSDNGINPLVNTYMYVRVRPADVAFAQTAATWQNVYSRVLANWNAMAPCMDNWLKLDDPVQVKAYGPMLKRLTDPKHFESLRFMPVTRDMSEGERTLLYKFLDEEHGEAEKSESVHSGPGGKKFADLSRAMRRA